MILPRQARDKHRENSKKNGVFSQAFNGITWAVSTTESMLGPYVDVPSSKNGATLPAGG